MHYYKMQPLRVFRFHITTWFSSLVNRSACCNRRSPSVVFGRHIMSTACSGSSCDEWCGFTVDYHVSRKCRLPRVFRFVSIDACLRLQRRFCCYRAQCLFLVISTTACLASVDHRTCSKYRQQLQLPSAKRCSCVAESSVFRCSQDQRVIRNVFITTRITWNL